MLFRYFVRLVLMISRIIATKQQQIMYYSEKGGVQHRGLHLGSDTRHVQLFSQLLLCKAFLKIGSVELL